MMGGLGHLDYVAKQCWESVSVFAILGVNALGLRVEKYSLVPIGVWQLYTVTNSKHDEFRG